MRINEVECDRCRKRFPLLDGIATVMIVEKENYFFEEEEKKKRSDLCPECFRLLKYFMQEPDCVGVLLNTFAAESDHIVAISREEYENLNSLCPNSSDCCCPDCMAKGEENV